MIFVSQSMLRSFNQDQAENWLKELAPRDKPRALAELFSASLGDCRVPVADHQRLDKKSSTDTPACSWLLFAPTNGQKQHPDFTLLHYIPTDVLVLVLPFLSPQSVKDVTTVALGSPRPRLMKEVLLHLPHRQILSQNSYLLQSCCRLPPNEAVNQILELLIPVSSWRAASRVLIDNSEALEADRLLSNPLISASDLEGSLSFAKYKGTTLPNSQAKYEKYLLQNSLKDKTKTDEKTLSFKRLM